MPDHPTSHRITLEHRVRYHPPIIVEWAGCAPPSSMRVSRGIGLLLGACLLAATGLAEAGGEPPLIAAIKSQDTAAARVLIAQGVDVNTPQADGATALHWAAHWDDVGTAALLLESGADVRATNELGVTPLYLACQNAGTAMVETLLAAGANPNATLPSGESVLMTAARTGSADIVRALLGRGADPHAREGSHQQTALMWAVSHRHPTVAQALIDHGADVHARSRIRPRVVHTGDRLVDRTSRSLETLDLGGFTPLLFAAREDAVDSARVLLAAGANVNDTAPTGASALVIAAHSGRGSVAALLLAHRALPNTHGAGYTALHTAVLRDDIGLVRALLAAGANPNVHLTKGTPVKYLSQEFALSSGLKGATPFWLAAKYVETEMMRLLAGAGADIELPIAAGTTPLMAAIDNPSFLSGITDRRGRILSTVETAALVDSEGERGTLDGVTTIVELGADVGATNRGGVTALHIAASTGHVPAMQVLTAAGADVNAADGRGSTPLHNAASQGHDAAVLLLAEQGANLEAETRSGQTPLAMTAVRMNRALAAYMTAKDRTSTAALLRRLGADR